MINLKIAKSILTVFALALIAFMWCKEVTERRARQAADRFMGPTLEVFEWTGEHFVPWVWRDSNGEKHGFSWIVRYEPRVGIDWPLDVNVDLLGHIRAINNHKWDRWIGMSDSERKKEQLKQIEIDRGNRQK